MEGTAWPLITELRINHNQILYNLLLIKNDLENAGSSSRELERYILHTESSMEKPDVAFVRENVAEFLKRV